MFPGEGDSNGNNHPWIRDETKYKLENIYKELLCLQAEILCQIHAPTQLSLPSPAFDINYGSITESPLSRSSSQVNFGSDQISTLPNPTFEINYGSSTQPALARPVEINYGSTPQTPLPPNNSVASRNKRKRSSHWTESEHRLFLHGLKIFGKGNWKNIAQHCVTSKTSTQIASHAQKYFLRQNGNQSKKRKSIHDATFEEDGVDNQNADLIPHQVNQKMVSPQDNQQMVPLNQEAVNVISLPLDQEVVNVDSSPLKEANDFDLPTLCDLPPLKEADFDLVPLKEADNFDLNIFTSDLDGLISEFDQTYHILPGEMATSVPYEMDSFDFVIKP